MEFNQVNNNAGDVKNTVSNSVSSISLTPAEKSVLNLLVRAWDEFIEMEPQNSIDLREFSFHVHALQNIVASRVAMRADPDVWKTSDICEGRDAYKLKEEKWKKFCKRFLDCYEGTDDVFDLYAVVKKELEGTNG